ncbi:MAG: hypothetical protein U9R50_11835 [Campylobacterota bacterium]|nr:hypothetical protein [Campylobacterota bacterium]
MSKKQKELITNQKNDWISQWKQVTWKLLNLETQSLTKDEMVDRLREFSANVSVQKRINFAIQCATTSAYYPLDTKSKQLRTM